MGQRRKTIPVGVDKTRVQMETRRHRAGEKLTWRVAMLRVIYGEKLLRGFKTNDNSEKARPEVLATYPGRFTKWQKAPPTAFPEMNE